MTSKERILAAINGKPVDHIPLTTWCFGFPAPKHLQWSKNGKPVTYWFSKRMEHLHTLPQAWDLEDDFKRVEAWLSLGIDDIVDVSVPWSAGPGVTFSDLLIPAGKIDTYPVLERLYSTPAGPLRHAVRQTGEDPGPGWVIQPECVPLIEDYNIPRAVRHAVTGPADVPIIKHLYAGPDAAAQNWFAARMKEVKSFADANGVLVQAWTAFGMDAVVWFTGTEGAIMLAMDDPAAFGRLVEIIAETDYQRTELAAKTPGVDMVCQRGWYSSTDFWSPDLFNQFVFPHIKKLTDLAHRHNKKFGYVMTTGVEILGSRLADAGVDVLYFADPIQDRLPLEKAKELAARMTLVGGTNALSLGTNDLNRIRNEVEHAIKVLGPTKRFILHPVDAIFPDTPWEGVEKLIQAWRSCQ
jgi:hypothetical protein